MLRFSLIAITVLVLPAARAADPPKVADLVRQLETGTAGERVVAAERLGDLGPAAAEAIPELRRLLDTGHVEVALAARDAIRKIEGGK